MYSKAQPVAHHWVDGDEGEEGQWSQVGLIKWEDQREKRWEIKTFIETIFEHSNNSIIVLINESVVVVKCRGTHAVRHISTSSV